MLRHKLEMVDSVCTKIWSGLKIRLVHSHKRVNLKIPSPLDIIKNAQNTPQTSLNFTLNPSDLQAKTQLMLFYIPINVIVYIPDEEPYSQSHVHHAAHILNSYIPCSPEPVHV